MFSSVECLSGGIQFFRVIRPYVCWTHSHEHHISGTPHCHFDLTNVFLAITKEFIRRYKMLKQRPFIPKGQRSNVAGGEIQLLFKILEFKNVFVMTVITCTTNLYLHLTFCCFEVTLSSRKWGEGVFCMVPVGQDGRTVTLCWEAQSLSGKASGSQETVVLDAAAISA